MNLEHSSKEAKQDKSVQPDKREPEKENRPVMAPDAPWHVYVLPPENSTVIRW